MERVIHSIWILLLQIKLAASFCYDAAARSNRAIDELLEGDVGTQDIVLKQIAETMFANGGYCASHPLKRNF